MKKIRNYRVIKQAMHGHYRGLLSTHVRGIKTNNWIGKFVVGEFVGNTFCYEDVQRSQF
jgi:hypothetical protein